METFNTRLSLLQSNYRYDYITNVKGKYIAPATTVETERARLANYIQSDVRFPYYHHFLAISNWLYVY